MDIRSRVARDFAALDVKGEGIIERDRMVQALATLPGMSVELIQRLMAAYLEHRDDNLVDYASFISWIFAGTDNEGGSGFDIRSLSKSSLAKVSEALAILGEVGISRIADVRCLQDLIKARLPDEDLAKRQRDVCVLNSNGDSYADGMVSCIAQCATVVGDVSVGEGSWVYEATVVAVGDAASQPSAIVGWADSNLFSVPSIEKQLVGDDRESWGVALYNNDAPPDKGVVARPRGNARDEAAGAPLMVGSTVSCAVKITATGGVAVQFAVDGKWEALKGSHFPGASVSSSKIRPAATLRQSAQLQFNFGERPFVHPVPDGFLPVQCHAVGDKTLPAPAWLRYLVPQPSAQIPHKAAAAGRVFPLLLQQLCVNLRLLQLEATRLEPRNSAVDCLAQEMLGRIAAIMTSVAPANGPSRPALQ